MQKLSAAYQHREEKQHFYLATRFRPYQPENPVFLFTAGIVTAEVLLSDNARCKSRTRRRRCAFVTAECKLLFTTVERSDQFLDPFAILSEQCVEQRLVVTQGIPGIVSRVRGNPMRQPLAGGNQSAQD